MHARQALELRRDGSLRLVVVADTHSRPDARSPSLIAAQHPDHILHGGDIGSRAVLDALADIAPVTAVRGNIDAQMPGVPDVVTIDVREGDATLLTMLLLHIALYGRSFAPTRFASLAPPARLSSSAGIPTCPSWDAIRASPCSTPGPSARAAFACPSCSPSSTSVATAYGCTT